MAEDGHNRVHSKQVAQHGLDRKDLVRVGRELERRSERRFKNTSISTFSWHFFCGIKSIKRWWDTVLP